MRGLKHEGRRDRRNINSRNAHTSSAAVTGDSAHGCAASGNTEHGAARLTRVTPERSTVHNDPANRPAPRPSATSMIPNPCTSRYSPRHHTHPDTQRVAERHRRRLDHVHWTRAIGVRDERLQHHPGDWSERAAQLGALR